MNLSDMFMFMDPDMLVRYYTTALIVVPTLVLIIKRDFLSVIVAVVVMAVVPKMFYGSIKKSRMKKFDEQLPDAFMSLASSLGAGTSLMGAIETLATEQPAPLAQEFSLLVRKIKLGVNFDQALVDMEKRIPSQDFRVALSAIRISREVGGNLVEVMEKLADTLRQKAAMEGKIVSLTSQGKMQGYVMTGLPILLACALNVIEPEAMSKLYSTTMGYVVLGVIVVMLGIGFSIIRKITTIDV
ncbi:MAG: type II secretion system F family protein [Pseudomonadales bacterium]